MAEHSKSNRDQDEEGRPQRRSTSGSSRRAPRSSRRGGGEHGGEPRERGHGPHRGREDARGRSREGRGERGHGDRDRGRSQREHDEGRRKHRDAGGGDPASRDRSRPGQQSRADRPVEPRIPAEVTGKELDAATRAELRGLSRETAERVARHLVAAHLLEEGDPETSLAHARFAARLGGRVGTVREIHGVLAYRSGEYATAARELRTAVRITGRTDVLPLIADCERGMGRPERALDIAASDEASQLGVASAIELIIVVAGAYADTGDVQTALRTLEIPALRQKVDGQWQVRLWVAYADLLERAGRSEESRKWLTLAADADTQGRTDAAERLGRPAPRPQPVADGADEELSVLDAYDESAAEEPPTTDGAEPALAGSADPGPEATA